MSTIPARFARVFGAIRAPWSPLAGAVLALLLLGPCLASTVEPARAEQPGATQGFLRYPDTNGRDPDVLPLAQAALAGSSQDGPMIGMRTWGGFVGIHGHRGAPWHHRAGDSR